MESCLSTGKIFYAILMVMVLAASSATFAGSNWYVKSPAKALIMVLEAITAVPLAPGLTHRVVNIKKRFDSLLLATGKAN